MADLTREMPKNKEKQKAKEEARRQKGQKKKWIERKKAKIFKRIFRVYLNYKYRQSTSLPPKFQLPLPLLDLWLRCALVRAHHVPLERFSGHLI